MPDVEDKAEMPFAAFLRITVREGSKKKNNNIV